MRLSYPCVCVYLNAHVNELCTCTCVCVLVLIDASPCVCVALLLSDGGKEVLSMHQVLLYLLRSSKPLVPAEEIADMLQWEELEWQKYAEECKGMIVTNPGMVRPRLLRYDRSDLVCYFKGICHLGAPDGDESKPALL